MYFDLDFANVAIFPTEETMCIFKLGDFPIVPSTRDSDIFRMFPPQNSIDFKRSNLPFYQHHPSFVTAGVVDKMTVNPIVREGFICETRDNFRARQRRRQMQSDFLGSMTKLTSGSIRADFSHRENMGMFRVGPDQFLYSFSCVFPWCIDIRDQKPNCAMTDTTFRILKPYTLTILAVIFANESIPIAFSVSPTEEANSYPSVYTHVIDILCEQIPSTNRDVNMLMELPLVSDMGNAIQKLGREKNFHWLFSHCHLIESVGSNSFVGECVRRLLRCCSENEYQDTSAVSRAMAISMHTCNRTKVSSNVSRSL
jgi:hypothetical protein